MMKLILVAALAIVTIQMTYAKPQYISSYVPRPVVYPAPPESPEEEGLVNRNGEQEERPNNEHTLLVNRVSQWPREKQPYWYINSQFIAAQNGKLPRNPTTTDNP